jgi:hypothetical protein
MGYRVTKDGEIICDTAEEAIALAKAMTSSSDRPRPSGRGSGEPVGRWDESRYKEFMSLIGGKQRDFMNALLENPHGRTDTALRGILKLNSNNALAGVTAGLSKNAKKVGIDSEEVFIKEKLRVNDEKVLEYKLAESFRGIAEKVGHGKDKK